MSKGTLVIFISTVLFVSYLTFKKEFNSQPVKQVAESTNSNIHIQKNIKSDNVLSFYNESTADEENTYVQKEQPHFKESEENTSLHIQHIDIGLINQTILDHLESKDLIGNYYSGINNSLLLEDEFELLEKEINPEQKFFFIDFSIPDAYGNTISFSDCLTIHAQIERDISAYRESISTIGYELNTSSENVFYQLFSINCEDLDNNVRANIKFRKTEMNDKTDYDISYVISEKGTGYENRLHVGNIFNQDGGIVYLFNN